MSIASAAIPIGDSTPVVFKFGQRSRVKVQVVFYSTAAAAAGDELAIGAGLRDVTVSTDDLILSKDRAYRATLASAYAGGVRTMPSRTWEEFEFADGSRAATVVAASNDDAGAVSYRVVLSIPVEVP